MTDAQEWLIDNLSAKKDTLIYFLHEHGKLDLDLLEGFYDIATKINNRLYDGNADALTVARLYTVHTLIMKYFASHFDQNDGYSIENLSADNYFDVTDKLMGIFDIRKLR